MTSSSKALKTRATSALYSWQFLCLHMLMQEVKKKNSEQEEKLASRRCDLSASGSCTHLLSGADVFELQLSRHKSTAEPLLKILSWKAGEEEQLGRGHGTEDLERQEKTSKRLVSFKYHSWLGEIVHKKILLDNPTVLSKKLLLKISHSLKGMKNVWTLQSCARLYQQDIFLSAWFAVNMSYWHKIYPIWKEMHKLSLTKKRNLI